MEYEKYIVPILASNESELSRNNYWGTGFIVGEYLITAGHVVNDFKYIGYIFEDIIHPLPTPCVNELGCRENGRYKLIDMNTLIKEDLAIFKIGDCGSPLQFGFKDEDMVCMYHGYSFVDNSNSIKVDHIDAIPLRTLSKDRKKDINCKFLNNIDLDNGNSGGPLFDGDKIVGMLVSGEETMDGIKVGCVCLSAWYIMNKICSIKHTK